MHVTVNVLTPSVLVLIGVPTGTVPTFVFTSASPSASVQLHDAGWLDPRGYVPPSIGDAVTIKERSGLYLLMMVLSVALGLSALWLGRRLAPSMGTWRAALTGLGGYVVVVGVVMRVLPVIAETPLPLADSAGKLAYPGFPADDLYHFRLYAVGAQVVIWATIGLVFGALVSGLPEGQRRQHHSA